MTELRSDAASQGCGFVRGETKSLEACKSWWKLLEYAVRRDENGKKGEVYGDKKSSGIVKRKTCIKNIEELERYILLSIV